MVIKEIIKLVIDGSNQNRIAWLVLQHMNYIDALLVLIVISAVWNGAQKGFIIGAIQLFCWLGGLLLTLLSYPYLTSFFQKVAPALGVWTVPAAFVLTLILSRVILGFIAEWFLKKISPSTHFSKTNKALGVVPGLITGVLYAAFAAILFLLLPLSTGFSSEVRESKVADQLSSNFEKIESVFAPVLEDVNRSLSKITVDPKSGKHIELGYTVKNTKLRPDLEAKLLLLVNEERRKEGLNELKADPEIGITARKTFKGHVCQRIFFSYQS